MKTLNNWIKVILLCCFSDVYALASDNPPTMAAQYVRRYEALERFNDGNERAGRKDLNQYIISLDTLTWEGDNEDEEIWIKEHPIIDSNYGRLSEILNQFNSNRKDKLRFYVIVAGPFQAQLKEGVKIEQLPGSFKNFDIAFKDLLVENDLEKVHHNTYGRAAHAMRGEIIKALKSKGYEERVIYFYASMRFFTLDGKEQYYSHDDMTLSGKLVPFSKKIRAKCRQNWEAPDIFGMGETAAARIEKAIVNIINAVEVEYDGGGSMKDGVVDCGKDIAEIENTNWPGKGDVYNNAAKRIAALLDAPQPSQRFKSPYFIVDKPENFTDPFIRDEILPDIVFNTQILPDKLTLLSQGRSQYKMYVIFGSVEFVLPDAERAGFARLVKEFSSVAKQANTIVLVVPYFSCVDAGIEKGDAQGNVYELYPMLPMPCIYSPDDAMTSIMNSALVREKSFQGGFNQAFKYVPKDYKVYDWKVLWNGDAIYDGVEEYKNVTGYEDLVAIRILQDIRLDKIIKATRDRNCGAEGIIYGTSESTVQVDLAFERMAKCQALLQVDIDRILTEQPQFQAVTGTSSLIQSTLTQEVSKKFVETFASRKTARNWGSMDDNLFYGKRNPFKSKDIIMTLIDIGSIVSSVVGLDFIFDGVGMVYAFSIGENEAGLLYAAALAVPLASGGALRTALIEGKNIVVKGSKGAYQVVVRKVYGLYYVVRHADDFSHLAKSALHPKSFNALSKYKSEATFVSAMEEGLMADSKAVQAINDNPGWVDEFNGFYKEGKGGLDVFLAAKTNGTLIDGEKIIGFRDMPNLNVASLGTDADIIKSVERIKPDPDWFDVIVHGSPDRFWVLHNGKWTGITHRDLNNYLKRNPSFQNAKGVRLVSCEAGTKDLAQNFANKSGKKVRAVSGAEIGVTKDGQIVATSGTGHWAEFEKGNWSVSFDNAGGVPQSNKIRAAKSSDEATSLVFFGNSTDKYKALKDDITYKDYLDQFADGSSQRVFTNAMSLEQEVALHWYVREGSALNVKLTTNATLTEFDKLMRQTINEALDKLPTKYQNTTYRGIKPGGKELQSIMAVGDGGEIVFKDFKSTAKSESVALTFNQTAGEKKYIGVFHSKRGTDISATRPDMEEVLIKDNAKFKVKIDPESNGIIRIHFHEVDNAITSVLHSVTTDGKITVFAQGVAESVGNGKLLSDGYIELFINVKIGEGGVKVANGEDVFEEIFSKISTSNDPNSIKGIRGLWSDDPKMRDNLDSFNKLILDEVKTGRMTEKQAALKTFTGKMAERKGFTEVSEISGPKSDDQWTYQFITYILFSKP